MVCGKFSSPSLTLEGRKEGRGVDRWKERERETEERKTKEMVLSLSF